MSIATEKKEGVLSTRERIVEINILISDVVSTATGNIIIDLSKTSGRPQAKIILHSSLTIGGIGVGSGGGYVSTTGTLTITSLTANQIEGNFSGVVNDLVSSLTITKGLFAGRF